MTSSGTRSKIQFKAALLPDRQYAFVPADLDILIPKARRPSKRALYGARQLVLPAKSRRIQKAHIRQTA